MSRFTYIDHSQREVLGLTVNEYCVLDLVTRMADGATKYKGWCHMTREQMAAHLGLGIATVKRCIGRLAQAGLVHINPIGFTQPDSIKMIRGRSERSSDGITLIRRWDQSDPSNIGREVKRNKENKSETAFKADEIDLSGIAF